MKKQKTPYYNAEENYKVLNTTEIGFVSNEGYNLHVAHIQDIEFRERYNGTIVRAHCNNLLVKEDISMDWIILYKCAVLKEFPHNINVKDNKIKYFAASKITGFYKIIDDFRVADYTNLIDEAKDILDAEEIENGYIRKLSEKEIGLKPTITQIGKIKDGKENICHVLKITIASFWVNFKRAMKNRNELNADYKKYKRIIAQVEKNHANFKGGK